MIVGLWKAPCVGVSARVAIRIKSGTAAVVQEKSRVNITKRQ